MLAPPFFKTLALWSASSLNDVSDLVYYFLYLILDSDHGAAFLVKSSTIVKVTRPQSITFAFLGGSFIFASLFADFAFELMDQKLSSVSLIAL